MPSFDIVSKTDLAEVDNALANSHRVIPGEINDYDLISPHFGPDF